MLNLTKRLNKDILSFPIPNGPGCPKYRCIFRDAKRFVQICANHRVIRGAVKTIEHHSCFITQVFRVVENRLADSIGNGY